MRTKGTELWRALFTPLVWWCVSTVLGAILLYWLSKHNWWAVTAGALAVTMGFWVVGTSRFVKAIESRYETQISTLKAERDKQWQVNLAQSKTERGKRCRNAVADTLRSRRDWGATVEELAAETTEFSTDEITTALRDWEEKAMVHVGGSARWIWDSSTVVRPGSGRFGHGRFS